MFNQELDENNQPIKQSASMIGADLLLPKTQSLKPTFTPGPAFPLQTDNAPQGNIVAPLTDFNQPLPSGMMNQSNAVMEEQQPGLNQVVNAIGRGIAGEFIGGTLQAMGGLLDYSVFNSFMQGEETFGKMVHDAGRYIQEQTNEAMPIYSENRFDPGWWASGLSSAMSVMSTLIPGYGVARGTMALGKLAGMSTAAANALATGIGAGVMRHSENYREAERVREQVYQRALEQGLGHENALAQASDAAATDYKLNSLNYVFDLMQLSSVLKPMKVLTRNSEGLAPMVGAAVGRNISPWKYYAEKAATQIGLQTSEGVEEAVNEISSIHALRTDGADISQTLRESLGSPQVWDSFLWGVAGGAMFQGVGAALNKEGRLATQQKLGDIAKREKLIQDFANTIKNNPGDEVAIKAAKDAIAFDYALSAVKSGNVDLALEQIANPDVLAKAGIENVDPQSLKELKDMVESVERSYKNYVAPFSGEKYNAYMRETAVGLEFKAKDYYNKAKGYTDTIETRYRDLGVDSLTPVARQYLDLMYNEASTTANAGMLADWIDKSDPTDPDTAVLKELYAKANQDLKAIGTQREQLRTLLSTPQVYQLNNPRTVESLEQLDNALNPYFNQDIATTHVRKKQALAEQEITLRALARLQSREGKRGFEEYIDSQVETQKQFEKERKKRAKEQERAKKAAQSKQAVKATAQDVQAAAQQVPPVQSTQQAPTSQTSTQQTNDPAEPTSEDILKELVTLIDPGIQGDNSPDMSSRIDEVERQTQVLIALFRSLTKDGIDVSNIHAVARWMESKLGSTTFARIWEPFQQLYNVVMRTNIAFTAETVLDPLGDQDKGSLEAQTVEDQTEISDPEVYHGIIPSKINETNDTTFSALYDTYEYDTIRDKRDLRLIPAAHAIAWLNLAYEDTITGYVAGVPVVKRTTKTTELLPTLRDPRMMLPGYYQPGTKLTLEEDKGYAVDNVTYADLVKKELGDPRVAEIEQRRKEALKKYDDEGGKYDDDYGKRTNAINVRYDAELATLGVQSNPKINYYRPIAVKLDGKIVGYVHDMDWINPMNVVEVLKDGTENLQKQRDMLINLRNEVIAKGSLDVYVDFKGAGFVENKNANNRNEQQLVKDAFTDPNLELVVSKNGTLYSDKDTAYKDAVLNTTAQYEGLVHAIVPLANGRKIALMLNTLQVGNEIASSLVQAVDAFIKRNTADKNDAAVSKSVYNSIRLASGDRINVHTADGIRMMLEQFIYTFNLEDSKSEIIKNQEKDGLTKRYVSVRSNGIDFQETANRRYSVTEEMYKSNPSMYQTNLKRLESHIANMYVKISLAKMGSKINEPYPVVLLDDQGKWTGRSTTYRDFIKNHTSTNLVSTPIPLEDGSTEYAYAYQPVITFTKVAPSIDPVVAPVQPTVEQTPVKEEEDLPQYGFDQVEGPDDFPSFRSDDFGLDAEGNLNSSQYVSNNYLIAPGKFDGYQQHTIIRIMMAHVLGRLQANPKGTVTEFFNELKQNFSKEKDPIFKEILAYFEPFQAEALAKLKELDFVRANNKFKDRIISTADETSADSGEREFVDDKSLLMDSKESMTGRLRQFFTFIPTGETSFLGARFPEFKDFDEVVNFLHTELVGIPPSFDKMLAHLESIKDKHLWIQHVITKLNSASERIKNEFAVAMAKQYARHRMILWNKVEREEYNPMTGMLERTGQVDYYINIVDSDQSSVAKVIEADWYDNLVRKTKMVVVKDGKLFISRKEAKEITDQLPEVKSFMEAGDVKPLQAWLLRMGIDMSENALMEIYQRPNKYFKMDVPSLFTSANGVFKILVDRLNAGELNTDENADNEATLALNNPLINNSGVAKLAKIDARFKPFVYSNSFRNGENNTVYAYSMPTFLSDRTLKLKTDSTLLAQLANSPFSQSSTYLKELQNPDSYLSKVFEVSYVDAMNRMGGGQTGTRLSAMSSREHEITKINLHANSSTGEEKRKIGHYLFPTFSDKTRAAMLTTVRHNTGVFYNNADVQSFDHETKEQINAILQGEINRMAALSKKSTKLAEYNQGGKHFLMFPTLNDREKHPNLWIGDKFNDSPEGVLEAQRAAHEYVIQLIEAKKTEWRKLGLIKTTQLIWSDITNDWVPVKEGETIPAGTKRRNVSQMTFVDNRYMRDTVATKVTDSNQQVTYIAADYVVNNLIALGNMFQLYVGDPALYWKPAKGGDVNDNILSTYDNLGKRLALLIAPGHSLADSWEKHFNYVFLKDNKSVSKNITEIKDILEPLGLDWTPYTDIEGTDAQELTTLREHLNVLIGLGRVTTKQAEKLIERANEEVLSTDDIKIIMQPIKPVYTNSIYDAEDNIHRVLYVKSSSFPLIPQLTKGLELDKVRQAMEAEGVDRVAYKTASKVGGYNYVDIWDPADTTRITDVETLKGLFKNNLHPVSREGFRLQQEVPYDDEKKDVTKGSQETKLLFLDILDLTGFKVRGLKDPFTGETLRTHYEKLHKQLYSLKYQKLLDELTENGVLNIAKLRDMMKAEAKGRGMSRYDIDSLDTIDDAILGERFTFPLWAHPLADKFESLLLSMVNKTVVKQKMPGKSYVLGSENGMQEVDKGQDVSNIRPGIVWIPGYDAIKGLNPQSIDGPAQVIAPFRFRDRKGNLLNVRDFMDANGRLDTSKVPEELLQLFGFRIPTQGHNSMSWIQIVGFLPEESGDLIITPKDFTKQMGSDFDVDKLYTYMYNTVGNYDEAALEALYDDIATKRAMGLAKGELKRLNAAMQAAQTDPERKALEKDRMTVLRAMPELAASLDEVKALKSTIVGFKRDDSTNEMALQNQIIDVHFAVMQHPEVWPNIISALGFGDLPDLASEVQTLRNKRKSGELPVSILSEQYYKNKYINGVVGKSMTGIKSLDSTLNATIQGKDMYFRVVEGPDSKVIPIVFEEYSQYALSGKKALDGRNKSYHIAAYQSAAVDNEKEQLLGKVNSNPYTASAERAILQVGYPAEFAVLFTSQDIILEFVEEMKGRFDSTTEGSSKDAVNAVLDILRKRYIAKGKLEENFVGDPEYPLTRVEMRAMLESTEVQDHAMLQLHVLEKFARANELGDALGDLQRSINTDSAGLDKNFLETVAKEQDVFKHVLNNRYIANSERAIGTIEKQGNAITVNYNTINGFAIEYGLNPANTLFENLYPTNSPLVAKMFGELSLQMGIDTTRGATLSNDTKKLIWDSFKSYLYATENLFINASVAETRFDLLYDVYSVNPDGTRLLLTPSLASQVKELANTPKGRRNAFLQKLDFSKISIDGTTPSLITYTASKGENYDEDNTYQAFIDLLVDPETHLIARDLITYSYLTGGLQKATNFIKYIPPQFLVNTGVTKFLSNVNFNNPSEYGFYNSSSVFYISRFAEQFLQHNPRLAPRINFKEFRSNISEVIETDEAGNPIEFKFPPIPNNVEDLATFPLKHLLVTKRIENQTYLSYANIIALPIGSNGNSKSFDSKSYKLFKMVRAEGDTRGNRFVEISTLGGPYNFSEYDPNVLYRPSIVDANTSKGDALILQKYLLDNSKLLPEPPKKTSNDFTDKYDVFTLDRNEVYDIDTIERTFDQISANATNEPFRITAEYLKVALRAVNPNTKLHLKNPRAHGTYYMFDNDGISRSPRVGIDIGQSKEEGESMFQRVFLHEFGHAITVDIMILMDLEEQYKNQSGNPNWKNPEITDAQRKAYARLTAIYKDVNEKVQFGKYEQYGLSKKGYDRFYELLNRYKAQRRDPAFNGTKLTDAEVEELKSLRIYYSLFNVREFATMVISDPYVIPIFNQIPYGDKNLLETILDWVKELLAAFGFVQDGSLLKAALEPVLEMVGVDPGFTPQQQTPVPNDDPMPPSSYVNHSGGAIGADMYWDTIGRSFGVVKHNHYYLASSALFDKGKHTPVSDVDEAEGRREAALAAQRNWGYQYSTMKDERLIRNWAQVKYADAVFAVGTIVQPGERVFPNIKDDTRVAINEATVAGGTGYAVAMAKNHGKPIYVFNQKDNQWYTWYELTREFIKTPVPKLTKNFAGIGTRQISTAGINAIKDVYTRTFGPVTNVSSTPQVSSNTYTGVITPDMINGKDAVFVFGSNPLGINGNPATGTGGAALVANKNGWVESGEKMVNKLSKSGKAWGIVTVLGPGQVKSLKPKEIMENIYKLYKHADENSSTKFYVAYKSEGRNLNGYTNEEMAGMFARATADNQIPDNIVFEDKFKALIDSAIYQTPSSTPIATPTPLPTPMAQEENFWDSLPKGPNGRYDLGGFEANVEQHAALIELFKWLYNGNESIITLSGYAGTGKTTIMNFLLKHARKRGSDLFGDNPVKAFVAAPTHKATNNITKLSKKDGMTIHSLLQLKPNASADTFSADNIIFGKTVDVTKTLRAVDVVIMDEASMINNELYKYAKDSMNRAGTKMLFLGDPAQLAPINESISAVFNENRVLQLTQIERTASTNPLIPLFTVVRNNLEHPDPVGKRQTMINGKGQGMVYYNNWAPILEQAGAMFTNPKYAFENDLNYVKILAYTNKGVDDANTQVRIKIYGIDQASNETWLPNEPIMSYYTIPEETAKGEQKEQPFFTNSSDYKIEEVTKHEGYYQLDLINTDTNKTGTVKVLDVNNAQAVADYKATFLRLSQDYENAKMSNASKAILETLYERIDAFRKEVLTPKKFVIPGLNTKWGSRSTNAEKQIDYGYAVTIHKSQGSTYENVIILEDTINAAGERDKDGRIIENTETNMQRNRLRYVAYSRASKLAIVMSRGAITENGYTEPTIETSFDDFGGGSLNSDRFSKLVDDLTTRINFLYDALAKAKLKKDTNKVARITNDIARLKNDIAEVQINNFLETVNKIGQSELNEIRARLNANSTEDELNYLLELISTWKNSTTMLQDDLEAIGENSDVEELRNIQAQATSLYNQWTKIAQSRVLSMIKQKSGLNVTIADVFGPSSDINFFTGMFRDISVTGDPLLQFVDLVQREAAAEVNDEYKEFADTLEAKMKPFYETAEYKANKFDVFLQKELNDETGENEVTGDLVNYKSKLFTRALSKVINPTTRENPTRASMARLRNFKRQNTFVMDPRKLMNAAYKRSGGTKVFTAEEIQAYEDQLIKIMGPEVYDRELNRLRDKIETFEELREAQKAEIAIKLEASGIREEGRAESLLAEYDKWHSPFAYTEWFLASDEVASATWSDMQYPSSAFVVEVPQKYDNKGKLTGWWDPAYEAIMQDPILKSTYEYLSNSFIKYMKYLPAHVRSYNGGHYVTDNTIPEVSRTLTEQYNERGTRGWLAGVNDKLIESITQNVGSEYSSATVSAITGRERANFIIRMLPSTDPTKGLGKEEKSYDLARVLDLFARQSIMFKHKIKVQDLIYLTNDLLQDVKEMKLAPSGNPIKSIFTGQTLLLEGLDQKKAMLESAIKAFHGQKREIEGATKKKYLTSVDKRKREKLNKKIIDLNLKYESGKITQEQYQKELQALEQQIAQLGNNFVMSRLGDTIIQYMQLKGLGWNVLSGASNVTYGILSNLIHAAGGEDFDVPTYMKSIQLVMATSFSPWARDRVEMLGIGNKIANLMNKFDVLKEIMDTDFDSFVTNNKAVKGLKNLAPYEIQRRGEYLAQGSFFVAMLKATKIMDVNGNEKTWFDAFNNDGTWNEAEFGPTPDLKKFKFKVDQLLKRIHGNYDPNSFVQLKRWILGRMLLQFRSWIAEGFAARFETQKYDMLLERDVKGRWRTYGSLGFKKSLLTVGKAAANTLTLGKIKSLSEGLYEGLDPMDKANMKKNYMELRMVATIAAALMVLLEGLEGDDDDDDKRKYRTMLNWMNRIENDFYFYGDPESFESITQNPLPVFKAYNDIVAWLGAIGTYVVYGEEADTIPTGIHAKESRLERTTKAVVPGFAAAQRLENAGKMVFGGK